MKAIDIGRQHVSTVNGATPVSEVARLMQKHQVTCLVVAETSMKPLGVISERDLVLRALAPGADFVHMTAAGIMSTPAIVCHADATLSDIVQAMASGGVAHLPLVDDEGQLGVAVVDFGGATTTFAVFSDGHPVYCDAIAIGGHHLTLDIARQLSVSIADAERLKTVYGSVLPGQADEREMISIVPVGAGADEAPGMIPRSHLTRILRPRVEEILTAIRDRMQATGMMDMCGRRFVLTGGGSELTGLPEVARRVLARNVRNGRPMGIAGLPEMAKGAAFATVAGLLIYPQVCSQEYAEPRGRRLTGTDGYFARVGNWLRTSF